MKRREILKYTAYVTGVAVSIPLATTLLSGCKTDTAGKIKDFTPGFFSKEEFSDITTIVDIILPKTDSPAASEVGVHKMIDSMTVTYDADKKEKYRTGFEALTKYLKAKANDKPFQHLPEGEKIKLLSALSTSTEESEAKSAFVELKQQTIAYYLNTEEIATNFLNYDPIPGDYVGCIALSEVNGKAWAL